MSINRNSCSCFGYKDNPGKLRCKMNHNLSGLIIQEEIPGLKHFQDGGED